VVFSIIPINEVTVSAKTKLEQHNIFFKGKNEREEGKKDGRKEKKKEGRLGGREGRRWKETMSLQRTIYYFNWKPRPMTEFCAGSAY
jgi:hypothetical protein